MGLSDLPPPVSGDWLADPAHWQRLGTLLTTAVTAHAARDPLAPGLPLEAARAELDLPDRGLVEALAAQRPRGEAGLIEASGGYLRFAEGGETKQQEAAGAARAPVQRPALPGSAAQAAHPRLPLRWPKRSRRCLPTWPTRRSAHPARSAWPSWGLTQRPPRRRSAPGLLRRLPGNVLLAPDAPGGPRGS